MSAPTGAPADLTGTTVAALKDQAQRLGLSWTLQTGTVVQGSDPAAVTVIVDGDTLAVPTVSMIGAPAAGARVFLLSIPPAGLYVVGMPGGTVARNLTNLIYEMASADLTNTAADQAVPGTLTTVATNGAATWEVTAAYDFHQTAFTATTTFIGSLYVDGVAQTPTALFQVTGVQRVTAFQQWSGAFTAGGNHTFGLRSRVGPVSGTSLTRITATTMLAKTYE